MADEGIFVHQFELGPWENFIYLVGDKATRTCAVVDPAWDADVILSEAEKLDVDITHVLCTHSHFDHVNRVDALVEKKDVPVHMLDEEIDFSGFRSENLIDRQALGGDLRAHARPYAGLDHVSNPRCHRHRGHDVRAGLRALRLRRWGSAGDVPHVERARRILAACDQDVSGSQLRSCHRVHAR